MGSGTCDGKRWFSIFASGAAGVQVAELGIGKCKSGGSSLQKRLQFCVYVCVQLIFLIKRINFSFKNFGFHRAV